MLCLACCSLMDGSRETLHMGVCILFMFITLKVCLWAVWRDEIICKPTGCWESNEQGGINLCRSQRLVHTGSSSAMCIHIAAFPTCILHTGISLTHTASIVITKEGQSADQSSASWNMKACLLTNSLQGSRPRSLWETQLDWTGSVVVYGINWMVRKRG